MTVAETVAPMSAKEARKITVQIQDAAGVTWDLIIAAYHGRAWAALGYASWDAYTEEEFGGCRLMLPREERREVITSLREAGMSTRAIAAAAGVHHRTVERDLASGGAFAPPDDDEVVDAEVVEEPAPTKPRKPRPVTGKDGKTYRPRKPKPVVEPAPAPAATSPLTPESRPRRGRRTYREDFEAFTCVEEARWDGTARDFPPEMVSGIAMDAEEFQLWVKRLEKARSQLSSYINALRREGERS